MADLKSTEMLSLVRGFSDATATYGMTVFSVFSRGGVGLTAVIEPKLKDPSNILSESDLSPTKFKAP